MQETPQMPPIEVLYPEQKPKYREKIIFIILLSLALMIGAGAIWLLAYDREADSERTATGLATEWGGEVMIKGPILSESTTSDYYIALPKNVNVDAYLSSEMIHRNIYQAEVYKGKVKISGTLGTMPAEADSIKNLYFRIGLSQRNLFEASELTIGGKKYPTQTTDYGIVADLGPNFQVADNTPYSIELQIRGAEDFRFKTLCKENSLTIKGNSSSASFKGSTLPDERSVSDSSYSATWKNCRTTLMTSDINGYAEDMPETYPNDEYSNYDTRPSSGPSEPQPLGTELPQEYTNDISYEGIGVAFVTGVDGYRKVVRAIKYAYLIILLTFAAVFATEILSRRNIPLLNYFLIGAALVVFYSLLLSISEQLNFDWAYAISSVMTIGLICIYLRAMLQSRQLALYNGAFLTTIYGICYVMLCVSTLALLIGSLMLFAAIAGTMYVSLRLK